MQEQPSPSSEYVCVQCGHPLLFAADRDPYARERRFDKKVRYLCGLFGPRVVRVAGRNGFVEYACICGHEIRTWPAVPGLKDKTRSTNAFGRC